MKYAEIRHLINTNKYTSVGCYPLFSVCKDGGVLCPTCVKKERALIEGAMLEGNDRQWEIIGTDVNWEDPALYCDHCSERIESAYAEPEEES